MPAASTSPFAPAHIRVLLLPVGRIRRTRWLSFLERLRPENVVRLGDISPDPSPDKAIFSPVGFPNGTLFYDLTTSLPPTSHLHLSRFESFRNPLLIICISDGKEYASDIGTKREDEDTSRWKEVANDVRKISDHYRQAILTQLLIFDLSHSTSPGEIPPSTLTVPPIMESKSTTIKTVMCDISAKLLAEMCILVNYIQSLESIESPGIEDNARARVVSKRSLEMFKSEPSSAPFQSTPIAANNRSSQQHNANGTHNRDGLHVSKQAQSISRPSSAAGGIYAQASADWPEADMVERTKRSSSNASTSARPASSSGVSGKDQKSRISGRSNTLVERGRSRLKARQTLLIGTMFLQAGRWPDALRELVDATTRARAFSDHAWHAKGLENILITMLMLAHAGVDFQIPNICYPISDKTYTRQSMISNANGVIEFRTSNDISHSRTLENLSSLLPDLIHMISNTYVRAASSDSEPLPQLCFSQSILRLASLFSALRRHKNVLTDSLLNSLIRDTPQFPSLHQNKISHHTLENTSRREISHFIFRAFPNKDSDINTTDMIVILSDMASVLSTAGLQRKHSLVCKELLSHLIPALIQARKMGAAEIGIHPAAGLAILQGFDLDPSSLGIIDLKAIDIRLGFRGLLVEFCQTFGIDTSSFNSSNDMPNEAGTYFNSTEESQSQMSRSMARILRVVTSNEYGGLGLKSDTLRLCANFAEALPDFRSASKFNALILRTAGPSAALANDSLINAVSLSRDEQIRLASKIGRNLNLGHSKAEYADDPDYWDEFLLRDISLSRLGPVTSSITYVEPQRMKSLSSTVARNGPFLYNAFQKRADDEMSNGILIARETANFRITLQNPFDFDLYIDNLSLVSDGIELSQTSRPFVILPLRLHTILVSATPTTAGTIRIIGCRIKVQGCRERLFLSFPRPWKPNPAEKRKRSGIHTSTAPQSRPTSLASDASDDLGLSKNIVVPENSIIYFKVAPPQPILEIVSSSLSQSILDLAEGETRSFNIKVRNISESVSADFFNLSFRGLTATTTSELDVDASEYVAWRGNEAVSHCTVAPAASTMFEVQVTGKLGVTAIIVHIDYSKLNVALNDIQDRFYARQLELQLAVTVSPSVQLQRVDIIPLSATSLSMSTTKNSTAKRDEFLLLLDIRNFWSKPLTVSLAENLSRASEDQDTASNFTTGRSTENVIQPGHVSRVALPLSKLLVKDPKRPLPQDETRQFVLRTTDLELDTVEAREAFWFHQALLNSFNGHWKETHGDRSGIFDLTDIRLSPGMVDIMRQDEVNVQVNTRHVGRALSLESGINSQTCVAKCNEFITLKTVLRNDSGRELRPFLRLYPRLKNYTARMNPEVNKSIIWTGLLQRPGPLMSSAATCEFETGLTFLVTGFFEVRIVVDEITTSGLDHARPLGACSYFFHISDR